MDCATSIRTLFDYHRATEGKFLTKARQAFAHAESCKKCWKEFTEKYCFVVKHNVEAAKIELRNISVPVTAEAIFYVLSPSEAFFLVTHRALCLYCELAIVLPEPPAPKKNSK